MQERIETRRLTLRRFAAGDWPDLYEYLSQPETVRYEPYDPFDETQARAEAARRRETKPSGRFACARRAR